MSLPRLETPLLAASFASIDGEHASSTLEPEGLLKELRSSLAALIAALPLRLCYKFPLEHLSCSDGWPWVGTARVRFEGYYVSLELPTRLTF